MLATHPRIDILVNAAGWNDIQPFIDNTPDYMDRVIAVNLGGPVHLTQALLPPMIAAGKGKIVNVSSDAGRVGSGGETVYAAAKGGDYRVHQVARARGRALLDQRQLRVPRPDRHADASRRARKSCGKPSSRPSRSAVSPSRRRSPTPSCFSPARDPITSPARF